MSTTRRLRLDDNLIAQIEQKRGNLTQNEYIRNALEHFITCNKEKEEIPALRPIISKFRGKCSKPNCGKTVEIGEPCYWAKGIIVCMDCMIQKGLGDKTLIIKYLKTRELNRTLKALENECDRLANQIENLTIGDRLEKLISQINERNNLLYKYLTEAMPSDKEKECLEELKRLSEKEKQMIRDLEIFMESKLNIKKWQKRAEVKA